MLCYSVKISYTKSLLLGSPIVVEGDGVFSVLLPHDPRIQRITFDKTCPAVE